MGHVVEESIESDNSKAIQFAVQGPLVAAPDAGPLVINPGAAAATEFCKRSGYAKTTAWKPANDIGGQTSTVVLSTGQVCNNASCDGFASITCSK